MGAREAERRLFQQLDTLNIRYTQPDHHKIECTFSMNNATLKFRILVSEVTDHTSHPSADASSSTTVSPQPLASSSDSSSPPPQQQSDLSSSSPSRLKSRSRSPKKSPGRRRSTSHLLQKSHPLPPAFRVRPTDGLFPTEKINSDSNIPPSYPAPTFTITSIFFQFVSGDRRVWHHLSSVLKTHISLIADPELPPQ